MKHLFLYAVIIIFNILSFTKLILLPGCFFYEEKGARSFKTCRGVHSPISLRSRGTPDCVRCDFDNIVTDVFNSCHSLKRCLRFTFSNETIFEAVFQPRPTLIDDILTNFSNAKLPKEVEITFRSYDPEKITSEYLKSLISQRSPIYSLLTVSFIASRSNHSYTSVLQNFLDPFVNMTILRFSCNQTVNDTKWVRYFITPTTNNFHENLSCISYRRLETNTTGHYSNSSTVFLSRTISTTVLDIQNISLITTFSTAVFFTRQKLYYIVPSSLLILIGTSIFLFIFTRYYCREKAIDSNVRFSMESFYSHASSIDSEKNN